jgi:hypothetical protein
MDNTKAGVIEHPSFDPSTMAPMGQDVQTQAVPDTSSGETPQNGNVGTDQTQAPQGKPGEGEGKLFAGKFKSVEDLEKSYTELQSHNTKVEMDRAELEKLFTQTQDVEETVSAPEQESLGEDLTSVLEKGKPVLQNEITKILAPVITKLEIQDMVNKYGDKFVAVAKEVNKLKTEKNISMEDAFKLATYPTVERTSYNQGVVKTNEVAEQKQKAIVESSRPSGYRPASLEDAVNDPNTSVEEIAEAAGPEYKAFVEISKRKRLHIS